MINEVNFKEQILEDIREYQKRYPNINNLDKTFKEGKYNNISEEGFQEGYYPTSKEIENLFQECEFNKIEIKSIRGIGYEKEDNIYSIKDEKIFNKIIELIEQTSTKSEIIEMCGHAMYIGKNHRYNMKEKIMVGE